MSRNLHKESMTSVRNIINEELDKLLGYASNSVYEDAASCVHCISYYLDMIFEDRKETESEIISVLGELQDIRMILTGRDLCYYDDNNNRWRR